MRTFKSKTREKISLRFVLSCVPATSALIGRMDLILS